MFKASKHAKERAVERFGFELTPDVLSKIEEQFKTFQARDFFYKNTRTSVWTTVNIGESEMRICYCPHQRTIITVATNNDELYNKAQSKERLAQQKRIRQQFFKRARREDDELP
jgi:hypothetical protein